MNMIDVLRTRVSNPKLRDPGPSDAELDLMIRCALRAPDHGLLRPWRFVVFSGAARGVLGGFFAEAARHRQPAAVAEVLERAERMPWRAPLVIVCVARTVIDHPKIPVVEQIASMAAAVQNLQLAAQALGYGAMWRTGPMAADAHVKTRLGLAMTDEIVAFLYVGTTDGEPRQVEALDPGLFVVHGDKL